MSTPAPVHIPTSLSVSLITSVLLNLFHRRCPHTHPQPNASDARALHLRRISCTLGGCEQVLRCHPDPPRILRATRVPCAFAETTKTASSFVGTLRIRAALLIGSEHRKRGLFSFASLTLPAASLARRARACSWCSAYRSCASTRVRPRCSNVRTLVDVSARY